MARGDWGAQFKWPLIGLHSILTPDKKVFTFGTDTSGKQGGLVYYDVWDPVTNTHNTLKHTTKVDMFCSAALLVPATDKIMVAGGDTRPVTPVNFGIKSVLEYDYRSKSIVKSPDGDMEYPRWYPTAVTLSNGTILVLGGRGGTQHGGDGATVYPELYTPGVGWKTLEGAGDAILQKNWYYPRAWVKSDGDVVFYGADGGRGKGLHTIDPTGDGDIRQIGTLPFTVDQSLPAIMFAPDKVLAILGNGSLRQIDFSADTTKFSTVGTVGATRYWSNMTVLADGKVMISGGSGGRNTLVKVTNQVALWDPETRQVTFDDTAATARLYHSTTLMLPDATVLSLGGGAPGPLKNLNGEIYKPDYLFTDSGAAAPRPVITTAPTSIAPSGTFQIKVDDASDIDRLTFVKNGAVTHSFNMDTRFVELPFTVGANNTLTVNHPDNANLLIPGYWMLFAIDDKGVPSVAKTVKVQIGGQTMVAEAQSFATLSGEAAVTASGSFELKAADGGNRGGVYFNTLVDLSKDASFSFDVKFGYCACGDGVTFLLHTNGHGESPPAEVIESGGLRLELGFTEGTHDHASEDGHGASEDHAAAAVTDDHGHGSRKDPAEGEDHPASDFETEWDLTKAAKRELAEDAWHEVQVSWDASEQSLAYSIDGAYAGKLTGEVVKAFLDDKTSATFGFVGGRMAIGDESHEVRLVDVKKGSVAGMVVGGDRGADVLEGGDGGDHLFGARGRDVLRGFDGDDVLNPGRGCDYMRGGAGDDEFVFCKPREASRGSKGDVIVDFVTGSDVINLLAIDADKKSAGDQAFRWLGEHGLDGQKGALCFQDGYLLGDINGDGKANFMIKLEGVSALEAGDILL